MIGRFPIYTDTDIHGPVVDALLHAGWDVKRGIDVFPERTLDSTHFERAAQEGRAFVTNDTRIEREIAWEWLKIGRRFRMIWWPRSHYRRMSPGAFAKAFEDLTAQEDPFAAHPILHLRWNQ